MNLEAFLLLFLNILMTIMFIILFLLLFKQERKTQIINMNSQDLAFAFYISLLLGLKGDFSLFLAFLSICSLLLFLGARKRILKFEEQKKDQADAHIIFWYQKT